MDMNALILYATTSGNTGIVANTFRRTLSAAGWNCVMIRITDETNLAAEGVRFDKYNLVLLGSPVISNGPHHLITENLGLVRREPPRLYLSPFFIPGADFRPDDTPLGVVFTTYSGETFGPHESLATLHMLESYLDYYYIDTVGRFACPGKRLAKDELFFLAEEMDSDIWGATKLFQTYCEDPNAEELRGQSEDVMALLAELRRMRTSPGRVSCPEFSACWHKGLQDRPNQRDLTKADIFLQEILEGYFPEDGTERCTKSVYTCIG